MIRYLALDQGMDLFDTCLIELVVLDDQRLEGYLLAEAMKDQRELRAVQPIAVEIQLLDEISR